MVFTDYLEDIMPKTAVIREFQLQEEDFLPEPTVRRVKRMAMQQIRSNGFPIPGPYERNHFLPLMETSYQLRDIALSVVSDALRIPRSQSSGRLTKRPWDCIKRVINLYASPQCTADDVEKASCNSLILRAYSTIAYCEWQVWASGIVYGIEGWRELSILKDGKTLANIVAPAFARDDYRGIVFPGLRYRAVSSYSHCFIAPMVHIFRQELDELFNRACDLYAYAVSNLVSENEGVENLLLSCLEQVSGETSIYGTQGITSLLPPNLNKFCPPDIVSEIEKELTFDHLRPIITKIAEIKLSTPKYEICREYALNMLKNEPQLPWNRVVPPTSQKNEDT